MMIIQYFLSAIVLGIVVAMPPGSVTIISFQRALLYGYKNSMIFTLGSCLSDIFYILLVYFGIASIVSSNEILKIILWIFCGFILLYLGIDSLITLRKNEKSTNSKKILQKGTYGTFLSGILVTLTNPMTIIGWIAIAGNYFLIWNEKYPSAKNFSSITIALIMIGVLIWFAPLNYFVSRMKNILSERIKTWLIIISNIFLISFGLIAFYYVYKSLLLFIN